MSKFKDLVSYDDEYEYEEIEEEVTPQKPNYYERREMEKNKMAGNVVSMDERVKALTSSFKLVINEPADFGDCPKLVDELKKKKPIIVNLNKLEAEIAKKIFDFMGGATYALDGNVQKIANNVFVFVPDNVNIEADNKQTNYFDGNLK